MALTPSDVYSPQVPGLATVLGSGLGPLRILQQEDYRRRAREAAAAKAKAELEKQFTPPTPDTDGGQIFAPQVAQSANDLLGAAKATYQQAVEGKITPNDAKALVAQRLAEHNTMTKQAKDSQAAINNFRDKAKANNLNVGKVGDFINMATTDPTTGKLMDVKKFDPEALAQGVTNGELLDKAGVVQSFLKGLAGKQETDYSTAARLGGTGITRSSASNIFASDAQGKTIYTLDSKGQRVPKIANIQALEQAALQDPQMAALLRNTLQEGQKPTATALMGLAPEHVTDDQLEALNAQTDQNTSHERQALADVIRPYGTLVQKEKETYRAPHFERAAAADKKAPIYAQPIEGDYTVGGQFPAIGNAVDGQPGSLATPVGSLNTLNPVNVPGSNITQQGAVSGYSVPAPLQPTNSGPKRFNTGTNGVAFNRVYAQGENGKYAWRPNVDKPVVGELGDAITLPVRPDGTPITPKDGAEYRQAIRDPKNEGKSFVQVVVPKNKNFVAQYQVRLQQLTEERNRQAAEGDEGAKRTTDAALADKAREEATGETSISYVPNEGQDARTVDRLTKDFGGKEVGSYRAHRRGTAAHVARIRGGAEATAKLARPSFLPAKAGATTPTRSTSPAADKSGGMM